MIRVRRFSGALRGLATHRVRTSLAASGVAIGVAAVVAASAISAGAEAALRETVQRMGTNLLVIKPLPVARAVFRPQIAGLSTSLRLDDFEAIMRQPEIAAGAPALDGAVRVKSGAVATRTTLRGTTPEFPAVRNFEVARGRFFDGEELRDVRRVAVLGARVAQALAPDGTTSAREVRIRGIPFEVIGVLRAKGATAEGADEDNQVLVPLSTAARRVFNVPWLTTIYLNVVDSGRTPAAERRIMELLRARHSRGSAPAAVDDFAVQDTSRSRAMQLELTRMLGRYGAGIAALALFVGGFGILAIMVLSVKERTREIGLRMAVGAQPRDILLQFLLEATVLALGGWSAGVVLAGAGAGAVAWTMTWPIAVPARAVGASFAMAVGIGLGFGVFPARSAARIPPVQALART